MHEVLVNVRFRDGQQYAALTKEVQCFHQSHKKEKKGWKAPLGPYEGQDKLFILGAKQMK